MAEGKNRLREATIAGLKVLNVAASAASSFIPLVGIACPVIDLVLKFVDKDENMEKLKNEFQSIHQFLDDLSKQNEKILEDIIKGTADGQFSKVERGLKWQYEKYMKMIDPLEETREERRKEFEEVYKKELGDQHLNTLYESVTGEPKMFSKPILQVYKEYSSDKETMKNLCHQLCYLFSIGCITLMANAVLIGDDVESLEAEWEEKMKKVWMEMEKALEDCQ